MRLFCTVLTTRSTEDSSLHAIEYLNLTMKRLSELITKLLKIALTWKKGGSLTLMAKALRQAIWNWIDNYPMEFVTLSQSVRLLSTGMRDCVCVHFTQYRAYSVSDALGN